MCSDCKYYADNQQEIYNDMLRTHALQNDGWESREGFLGSGYDIEDNNSMEDSLYAPANYFGPWNGGKRSGYESYNDFEDYF